MKERFAQSGSGPQPVHVSGLVLTSNKEIPSHWGAPTNKMKNRLICKRARGYTQKKEEEIRIGIKMPASIEVKEIPSGTQDYWDCGGGNQRATPYNNRFNLPGLAVTSFAYAKAAPVRSVGFCFAGASLTHRPQVNRALYGRNKKSAELSK
jgi:hypothetical protein